MHTVTRPASLPKTSLCCHFHSAPPHSNVTAHSASIPPGLKPLNKTSPAFRAPILCGARGNSHHWHDPTPMDTEQQSPVVNSDTVASSRSTGKNKSCHCAMRMVCSLVQQHSAGLNWWLMYLLLCCSYAAAAAAGLVLVYSCSSHASSHAAQYCDGTPPAAELAPGATQAATWLQPHVRPNPSSDQLALAVLEECQCVRVRLAAVIDHQRSVLLHRQRYSFSCPQPQWHSKALQHNSTVGSLFAQPTLLVALAATQFHWPGVGCAANITAVSCKLGCAHQLHSKQQPQHHNGCKSNVLVLAVQEGDREMQGIWQDFCFMKAGWPPGASASRGWRCLK